MKISELAGTVQGIRDQVTKISVEQQKRFDALSAKITELENLLNNQDLPPEVDTAVGEVKNLLQQLDDTIPDTTT